MFKKLLLFPFVFLFANILVAQDPFTTEILIHREEYKSDFLKNERSPIQEREDLQYLRFFDPDKEYSVQATFQRTKDAKPFDMATYSGVTKPYVQYGWLTFKIKGQTVKMAIYQSLNLRVMPQYRDYLFLPFKDLTNGESTYGGGRYMDFKTGDIKDGKMKIDFNKAYNPWCAFSDGYSCPIPPKENHLNIEILAGEKKYAKENH
ncbi:MAG: DUF1684 domain-containing protein [Saprospiraceae bacterium]